MNAPAIDLQLKRMDLLREIIRERNAMREAQARIHEMRSQVEQIDARLDAEEAA